LPQANNSQYEGRIIIDPYLDRQVNKSEKPQQNVDLLAKVFGMQVSPDADDRRVGVGSQKKFRWEGYHNIDPLKQDSLDNNKYFLMDYSIRAFALKSRKWGMHLHMDSLSMTYILIEISYRGGREPHTR